MFHQNEGKKKNSSFYALSTLSLSLSSSSSLSDIEEHISFATRTKRKLSLTEEALVYLRTKKQTLNREREREREMTRNTSSDEMETKSTKELFALAREKMTTRTSSGINGGGDDKDGSFFLREAIEMFAEVFRRCDSAGCFDDDDANKKDLLENVLRLDARDDWAAGADENTACIW